MNAGVLVTLLVIQGIVLLCLIGATGFLAAYALGVLYGVSYGAFMVMIPALTSYLFGLRAMGGIFATISIAEGTGFGLGATLAGYIWDVTGSYHDSFLLGAALILIALLLTLLLGTPGRAPGRRSRKALG